MAERSDLTGRQYGRLTVVRYFGKNKYRLHVWRCVCSCGNEVLVTVSNLNAGKTNSCGCYKKEVTGMLNYSHGQTVGGPTSEYVAWVEAKERCNNPNNKNYHNYGGRGIKMCDRWVNSFNNFFEDMGLKPSTEHSLDRYPNNESGHYGPDNCRWGTDEEQARNRRNNVWYEYNGLKMVLADWAKKFGVTSSNVKYMLTSKSFPEVVEYYKIVKHKTKKTA